MKGVPGLGWKDEGSSVTGSRCYHGIIKKKAKQSTNTWRSSKTTSKPSMIVITSVHYQHPREAWRIIGRSHAREAWQEELCSLSLLISSCAPVTMPHVKPNLSPHCCCGSLLAHTGDQGPEWSDIVKPQLGLHDFSSKKQQITNSNQQASNNQR